MKFFRHKIKKNTDNDDAVKYQNLIKIRLF